LNDLLVVTRLLTVSECFDDEGERSRRGGPPVIPVPLVGTPGGKPDGALTIANCRPRLASRVR